MIIKGHNFIILLASVIIFMMAVAPAIASCDYFLDEGKIEAGAFIEIENLEENADKESTEKVEESVFDDLFCDKKQNFAFCNLHPILFLSSQIQQKNLFLEIDFLPPEAILF